MEAFHSSRELVKVRTNRSHSINLCRTRKVSAKLTTFTLWRDKPSTSSMAFLNLDYSALTKFKTSSGKDTVNWQSGAILSECQKSWRMKTTCVFWRVRSSLSLYHQFSARTSTLAPLKRSHLLNHHLTSSMWTLRSSHLLSRSSLLMLHLMQATACTCQHSTMCRARPLLPKVTKKAWFCIRHMLLTATLLISWWMP